MTDEFELRSSFGFEAAHHLPAVPPDHRCHRIHGHSYSVEVRVTGPTVAPYDWVIDLGEIEKACDGARKELDHRLLNEVPGLENPTCEMLARWLWHKLETGLPGLSAVVVRETARSSCVYRGPSSPSE